jgi:hypothetical protein
MRGTRPAALGTGAPGRPSSGNVGCAVGDPLFGFRVGSLVRPGTFHALGLGIVSSTSVLAALNRIQRYSSIVSTNGRLALLQQEGSVGLVARPEQMSVMPTIHCVDARGRALPVLGSARGHRANQSRRFMRPRRRRPIAGLGCRVEFDGPHIAIWFDAVAARTVLAAMRARGGGGQAVARYMDELVPIQPPRASGTAGEGPPGN